MIEVGSGGLIIYRFFIECETGLKTVVGLITTIFTIWADLPSMF